MTEQIKLNLGCGHDFKEGYINVDHPDAYVFHNNYEIEYHDLSEFPWPWDDGEAEHIYMKEILEHLPDPVRVMKECKRVLGQGKTVEIIVPHVLSPQGWRPWDHKTYWTKGKLANIGKRGSSLDAMNRRLRFDLVEIGSDRSLSQILREWWNWGHPVRIHAVFRKVPVKPGSDL